MAKVCPPGFYCIEVGNLILIVVAAVMVFIGYLTGFNLNKSFNENNNIYRRKRSVKKPKFDDYEDNYDEDNERNELVNRENELRKNENDSRMLELLSRQQSLMDNMHRERRSEFNPPERRINIRTRGEPEEYQQVGVLRRSGGYQTEGKDDTVISGMSHAANLLGLYGRQTYPGSNRWEYFYKSGENKIVFKKDGSSCSGDNSNCREISNGDVLNLPEFNGEFTVSIYPYDSPRYLPHVL